MLICIVVLFLFCWGPRLITEILLKIEFRWKFTNEFYWTRVVLFLLPFIHAIFNPIVYFIMSQNFRRSAVKKFQQCTTNNIICQCFAPFRHPTLTENEQRLECDEHLEVCILYFKVASLKHN